MSLKIRTYSLIAIWGTAIVISALFGVMLYQVQKKEFMAGVDDKLVSGALMARGMLGPNYHDRITGQGSVSQEEFRAIVGRFNEICLATGYQYLWSNLFLDDGTVVFTSATSTSKDVNNGDYAAFFDVHSDPGAFQPVKLANQQTFSTFQNEWGAGRMVLIPYQDQRGRTYVFGASISVEELGARLRETALQSLLLFLAILGLGTIASFLLSRLLTTPLGRLARVADAVSKGDYEQKAAGITRVRELAVLADVLNSISDNVAARKMAEDRSIENEKALRHQERFLDQILENLPHMVFVKDAKNLSFVHFNKAGEELIGVPRSELIGKSDRDFFPPDQAEFFNRKDWEVLASHSPLDIPQEPIESKTLGSRILHTRKIGIYDDNGEAEYLLGVSEDITEKIATEEALERAQSIARIGSWTLDTTTGSLTWSDEVFRIFGLDPSEFGASYLAFLDAVHPDDREMVIREYTEALKGLKPYDIEHRIFRQDTGEVRWVHERCEHVRDESGKALQSHGTVQDITERKQAEEALKESENRLETLTQIAPVGVFYADANGHGTYVNEQVQRICGLSAEATKGMGWARALHPDDADRVIEEWSAAVANATPWHSEFRFRRADGVETWVIGQATPWFGAEGEHTGFAGTLTDITRRKQTEEALVRVQKMQAVGQLTGGIAHDFNNLLAVIQGNAELLAEGDTDNAAFVAPIIKASERGAELTHRLLAFSRRQPLHPRAFDLAALVDDTLDMLVRTLRETIEIKTSAEPGLWPVLADPGQVQNALLNLAINARDAMPAGGTLTINCANIGVGEGGEFIELSVTDTGFGMTEEQLARAFEPFYTTKDVGKGSGLGLSMVYGFAQQSGGRVSIESELDVGTAVRLLLPRADVMHQPEAESEGITVPLGHGEKILVVEDEDEVRDLVVRMLEGLDYFVVDVANANQAREALQGSVRFDLLLSDIVLPGGISGPQFVSLLRKSHPGLKIIFMSGYAEEAPTESIHPGAADFILDKPFRRRTLAEALRSVLD